MKKLSFFLIIVAFLGAISGANAAPGDYFGLSIVDAETGRGVPLVEVTTTSEERFVSDSNGFIAIDEPELMGQNVYFSVKSHGYELGADGFGNRGQAFEVKAGGRGQIKIKRINIAQRLYRITGAGIYRDSVLLGEKVPLARPLLSGQVTGQDTVMAAPYKGKIYWFYGDTERPSYPLGNFATSGATSLLPENGGLSPEKGVDLTYWTDENGFSKKMLPLSGFGGPVWVGGVFSISENGQEFLYSHYVHLDGGGKVAEHGLALFNDEKALFEKISTFPGPLFPDGQPIHVRVKGVPYLYFQGGSVEAAPFARVRADRAHILNPLAYEAFTPLKTGTSKIGDAPELERDANEKLVYSWKANTALFGFDARKKAIETKTIQAEEAPFQLRDIESDAPIQSHGGSVHWNDFRKRWVMISGQAFGNPSYLGELWFAEADTPAGPWVYARKILTHSKYTFYNPTQHPFFDQNGGRQIYFEGTYTTTYAGNDNPTPRYDYNQIMYRLDVDDARLNLPAPVYALANGKGAPIYEMRETIEARKRWPDVQNAPFFAVPPTRTLAGTIPIFRNLANELSTEPTANAQPLFYALPAAPTPGEKTAPSVVPLYVFRDEKSGLTRFSTEPNSQNAAEKRAPQPLCRVWRNPSTTLALDWEAQPTP